MNDECRRFRTDVSLGMHPAHGGHADECAACRAWATEDAPFDLLSAATLDEPTDARRFERNLLRKVRADRRKDWRYFAPFAVGAAASMALVAAMLQILLREEPNAARPAATASLDRPLADTIPVGE